MSSFSRHGYLLAAATEKNERVRAFQIRYEAYVEQGFIEPNATGLFSDSYDQNVNCPTWLLYRRDQTVGSIRTCIFLGKTGWNKIPCMEAFADVLESNFHPQSRLVELSRISVTGGAADRKAILALCSSAPCVGDHFGCDYIVAAFRKEHFSFYSHLKFEQLCSPRSYPGVNFPTILAALNWKRDREHLTKHALFNQCLNCPWDKRGIFDSSEIEL